MGTKMGRSNRRSRYALPGIRPEYKGRAPFAGVHLPWSHAGMTEWERLKEDKRLLRQAKKDTGR